MRAVTSSPGPEWGTTCEGGLPPGLDLTAFLLSLASRQGALAYGAEISRTQERHRTRKTNVCVQDLAQVLVQACLNVTPPLQTSR